MEWWGMLAALAKDLNFIPSIHGQWFTMPCTSRSMGVEALFWPTCTYVHACMCSSCICQPKGFLETLPCSIALTFDQIQRKFWHCPVIASNILASQLPPNPYLGSLWPSIKPLTNDIPRTEGLHTLLSSGSTRGPQTAGDRAKSSQIYGLSFPPV